MTYLSIAAAALFSVTVFCGINSRADVLEDKLDSSELASCTGWASEITEILGALHDQIDLSRVSLVDTLYQIEELAAETCIAKTDKAELAQRHAKLTKALEKEMFNTGNPTAAERVLTNALLRLFRQSTSISLTSTH